MSQLSIRTHILVTTARVSNPKSWRYIRRKLREVFKKTLTTRKTGVNLLKLALVPSHRFCLFLGQQVTQSACCAIQATFLSAGILCAPTGPPSAISTVFCPYGCTFYRKPCKQNHTALVSCSCYNKLPQTLVA